MPSPRFLRDMATASVIAGFILYGMAYGLKTSRRR